MKNTSKFKLHDALLELIELQKFKDITVNMICETANISRSTFYRHFTDKYELLFWHFDDYLKLIFLSQPNFKMIKNCYSLIFVYINNNRKYFKYLISFDGQNSFEDVMFIQITEYFRINLMSILNVDVLNIKTIYSIEMFTQALIRANIKWIQRDFKETPEEMTQILVENIPIDLRKYFSVK